MSRDNMGDMRDVGGVSMWEDSEESPAVRQLLRAGRAAQYSPDYDVERGLARHLANLSAGAPIPSWYTGIAGVTAAAATTTTSAVQKGATSSLWAWLVPPVVGAGLVSAWLWVHPSEPAKPAPVQKPAPAAVVAEHEALAPPMAAVSQREIPSVIARDDADEATRDHNALRASKITRRASSSRAPAHRELAVARPHRVVTSTGSDGDGAPSERGIGIIGSGSSVVTGSNSVDVGADAVATNAAHATGNDAARSASQPMAAAAEPARTDVKDPAAPAPRVESDSKLEREMQMLAVAQRVLSDDPERALKLTRQGEQEFGKSMFSAERKQVSLLALVQLGRLDEARRLGVPFLRAYPKAPWSARLREALSTGRLPAR